jgi:endonuclease/exonuclease/phosphatase family metal-dependent hydrolase
VTLKVLTLNLWNTSGPWEARKPRIREWVDKLGPHVIGFQEALRGPSDSGANGFDQVGEILDGAGYEIHHGAVTKMNDVDFGNAVASIWPITDRFVEELPRGDRSEGRCAVSATIDAPFGELSFTSTHLNWKLHDGHSREQQVVALADIVLKHRPRGGFPPIVVGDFNADPESSEIRFMCGHHSLDQRSVAFFDAWRLAGDGGPGTTWSNSNEFAQVAIEPDRRIDYVFAGYPVRMGAEHGLGKIEACRVVCNDEVDGVWPSDHYGVYAEIRTEPLPRPRWTMS